MALTKCCCCVDLLKGVKILGIILIILTLKAIGISIFSIFKTGNGNYFGIIGSIPSLLVNILLVVGCEKRKRVYFLPWLVVFMLSIVGSVILACVWIYFGTELIQQDSDATQVGAIIFFVVAGVLFLSSIIFSYYWSVVLSLYREMGKPGNRYEPAAFTTTGFNMTNMDQEKR